MATQSLTRSLLFKPKTLSVFLFSRPFSAASSSVVPRPSLSLISRLRPLSVAVPSVGLRRQSFRCFSASPPPNSISDPNPNLSNRPPKESILLDGCDFEHWLVVVEKPQGDPTRDEIIDSYIKTLAKVVGSEEEARQKIYSVSTRCYYAFGCLVTEELSYKIKEIPGVRWVLPDSYLDVKNKDYGGEPFINGEAVPYDPKYHEEWIRNNARATERNKRNDRPRAHDNSRTFERRRDNMQNPSPNQQAQNQGYQNRPRPNQPMQNQGYQNRPGPNQPMQNQGYQNRPGPNQPMQNQGYQNRPGPNQPMQNQGYQNRPGPNQPMQNQGYQNHPEHNQGYPNHSAQDQGYQNQDFQYSHMANQPIQNQGMQNTPPMPPNNGGAPFYNGEMPPNYTGPNATGGMQPNYTGGMPPNASMSEMPPNASMSEMPPSDMKWDKPSNAGATPPDAGCPDNSPNRAAAAGGGYPQN